MIHYGAVWGPEASVVLSTERMRERAIVKRGLHEVSPSILPTTLGSREEQFPSPGPAGLCAPVVQAPGQEGAHVPKWTGAKPATAHETSSGNVVYRISQLAACVKSHSQHVCMLYGTLSV